LSVVVNDEPMQGSPFLMHVRQAPHLLGRPVRVIKELNSPYMVAITSTGELVVSEDFKISIFSGDGKRIRSIDTTSVRLGIRRYKLDPYRVAVDEDSNIYLSGTESHRLSKLNSDGKLVKSVGGEGNKTGWFDNPRGIALSKDNKLFVCDRNNQRIQVFDTKLKFIFGFGKQGSGEGEMGHTADLTFDLAGNLYVADSMYNRVQVFSMDGTYLRAFRILGSTPSKLPHLKGIHVDHDYVYVAECWNNRVSVFHTSGAFITSLAEGAVERENWRTQMGSPLTRMDSCMSVTLTIIVFKSFEQYVLVHSLLVLCM